MGERDVSWDAAGGDGEFEFAILSTHDLNPRTKASDRASAMRRISTFTPTNRKKRTATASAIDSARRNPAITTAKITVSVGKASARTCTNRLPPNFG